MAFLTAFWCRTKTRFVISFLLLISSLLLFILPQIVPDITKSFSIELLLKSKLVNCSDREPGLIVFSDQLPVRSVLTHWENRYFNNNSREDSLPASVLVPAPHIQDCRKQKSDSIALDTRDADGRRPQWSFSEWESELTSQFSDAPDYKSIKTAEGPHPPWIEGGDQDNLPMTRQVQTDLWLHQHPKNCSDESVRFLVNDWINSQSLGLGGQIVAMMGIFAIALNEKRILVTQNFNRADHEECKGSSRARWSCYFTPETSQECRDRAMKLMSQKKAWKKGLVANLKSFPREALWFGKIPEYWGKPWETMQPLDVVSGEILGQHGASDRQWWRAQALRYFMRFPSEYLCTLLNKARHESFGARAAELIAQKLPRNWPQAPLASEEFSKMADVWAGHKPWIPRPLLSVHVRQGDKASEMKLFEFNSYIKLAEQVRTKFPHLKDIWLSTEMQNVVEESRNYTDWRFHFTIVARQNGTTSMGDYEKSLGRITSSSNAFINFMMATDCDYFVGALGSTWSFLIDGMRVTGGKRRAAFLSVNKDRYWD